MAASVVASWRVVGTGFHRLAAGVALLIGLAASAFGAGVVAGIACALAGIAVVAAARPGWSMVASGAAAVGFLIAAAGAGVVPALTGALALGGVTGEMLLGHWYLVDPRLPRSALRRLDAAGATGLLLDAAALAIAGALAWQGREIVVGWVFLVMAAASVILMVAVWFALGEPSYSGVMAATGLSYLAVLTSLAAVSMGRWLVAGEEGGLALGRLLQL